MPTDCNTPTDKWHAPRMRTDSNPDKWVWLMNSGLQQDLRLDYDPHHQTLFNLHMTWSPNPVSTLTGMVCFIELHDPLMCGIIVFINVTRFWKISLMSHLKYIEIYTYLCDH